MKFNSKERLFRFTEAVVRQHRLNFYYPNLHHICLNAFQQHGAASALPSEEQVLVLQEKLAFSFFKGVRPNTVKPSNVRDSEYSHVRE